MASHFMNSNDCNSVSALELLNDTADFSMNNNDTNKELDQITCVLSIFDDGDSCPNDEVFKFVNSTTLQSTLIRNDSSFFASVGEQESPFEEKINIQYQYSNSKPLSPQCEQNLDQDSMNSVLPIVSGNFSTLSPRLQTASFLLQSSLRSTLSDRSQLTANFHSNNLEFHKHSPPVTQHRASVKLKSMLPFSHSRKHARAFSDSSNTNIFLNSLRKGGVLLKHTTGASAVLHFVFVTDDLSALCWSDLKRNSIDGIVATHSILSVRYETFDDAAESDGDVQGRRFSLLTLGKVIQWQAVSLVKAKSWITAFRTLIDYHLLHGRISHAITPPMQTRKLYLTQLSHCQKNILETHAESGLSRSPIINGGGAIDQKTSLRESNTSKNSASLSLDDELQQELKRITSLKKDLSQLKHDEYVLTVVQQAKINKLVKRLYELQSQNNNLRTAMRIFAGV